MNKRYYEHTLSTTREFIEYLQKDLDVLDKHQGLFPKHNSLFLKDGRVFRKHFSAFLCCFSFAAFFSAKALPGISQ